MATFAFTIQLAGIDPERNDYKSAFYGAECDDALLSVVDGKIYLDFDRDAPSYDDAVQSAIRDVRNAGGEVVTVNPIVD